MTEPAPAYCDSCDERTATPPVCEDCRAAEIDKLTGVLDAGWQLSRGQALWLLAEVGRLRDTIYRRGEEYDAERMQADLRLRRLDAAKRQHAERLTLAQAEADLAHAGADDLSRQNRELRADRDRLAGQVQRVRGACGKGVIVYAHDVLAALDGEVPP